MLTSVDPTEPDVDIRFESFSSPDEPCILQTRAMRLYASSTGVLERPNRIRVRIDSGRTFTVDMASDMDDSELHTSLFGLAFGILAHQRGVPPLHASALQIGDQTVVLAGHSGMGKSTTARALVHRGHRILADDQVVIDPERLLVHPSFPAMRLWGSTASALGEGVSSDLTILPGLDKYHVPSTDVFHPDPGNLGVIFVLSKADSLDLPMVERLSAIHAVPVLTQHIYKLPIAAALGRMPDILQWTARIATRIPVYRLRRPDNLAALDLIASLVEQTASAARPLHLPRQSHAA